MSERFNHGGDVEGMADGLGVRTEDILDFSANINPYGPPDGWLEIATQALRQVAHYPDPHARDLVAAIAGRHGLDRAGVVVANGASEALDAVMRAFSKKGPGRAAVVPVPCYSDYARAAAKAGCEVRPFALRADNRFAPDMDAILAAAPKGGCVVLGRPNNPTGIDPGVDSVAAAAAKRPDLDFLVDESFLDFIPGAASAADAGLENIVVAKSLTKFYSIPALRVGFAAAAPEIAARVRTELPCWPVNAVAMRVAGHALRDAAFAASSIERIGRERERFAALLRDLPGLDVFPGTANFLLLRLRPPAAGDAHRLARTLLHRHRIAIRTYFPEEHLDAAFFRVAVRRPEDDDRLVAALREANAGSGEDRLR
ncbi:MAG: aminotransferase class I/II-fold pyridoxal phosphate-dependent enzyme [Planctomycetota bacterium]|jgi:L-threonine-O-3-phosphate decarboxylase|nr:aminotransferase class I/II-fold pyridoxal phosphate-dependent enzyme [Planctomycetota bacterium]